MNCRNTISLFSCICILLSYSSESIAVESPLYLSYEIEIPPQEISPLPEIPKEDEQEKSPPILENTDGNTGENNEVVTIETPAPLPMGKGKIGFIDWILPQIGQAREEIENLISKRMPNSLIVAQAALESGWGTSFGAKNRQNLFGLMKRDGHSMIFSSSLDGVKKYILTLEKLHKYRPLRMKLGETTDSLELTKYLTSYCNCSGYSNKLNKIIRENGLAKLDE